MKHRELSVVGLAVAVVLGGASSARGQEAARGDLTILDAVDQALARYPAVQVSVARREAAGAAADEAEAARWPSLRLGYSATQYEEPMIVSPIHGFVPGSTPPFDRTLFQGSGDLSYLLFDGGARGGYIGEARALSGAAESDLADTRQAVMARVVMTYVETLTRRGVLAAHERRLEALRAERDRVGRLLDVGRAARVDLLRVEAALASSEADRVRAAVELDMARRDLARLIGESAQEIRPERLALLESTGPELASREDLVREALRVNPALDALRRERAAAEARVSVARGARWPRLDLAGSYRQWGSADGHFTGEWNAGLRLSLPVFTGGEIGRRIEAAEARSRGAEANVWLAETEMGGEVDRAVSGLEEARARVLSLRTAVARFGEVVRIEQLRLETGTGTQTDYLKAEADLLEARSGLVQMRHAELLARVELARLVGRLDRDWVRENLEAVK